MPICCAFMGIDPGIHGAVVIQYSQQVKTYKMPATPKDVVNLFDEIVCTYDREHVFCVLEKVTGHISGVSSTGSASFQFGKGVGRLEMALAVYEIPYDEVAPQTWQKGLGVIPRKGGTETKTQWKNRLKQRAQSLFPKVKVTLDIADALLLSEYCKRKSTGTL